MPAQPRHVGLVLRRAREALGEDLRSAGTQLCLRTAYLKAIEDGRFEDLPGHAYAVGFVRAYALHLGLDGDKLVRRFKEENGGAGNRPDLIIPEPQSEGRVPGRALVLGSLFLAAAAYGGWYYLASQHRAAPEIAAANEAPRPAPATPAVSSVPARATGGIDTSIAAAPRSLTQPPPAGSGPATVQGAKPVDAAQSFVPPAEDDAETAEAPAQPRPEAPQQQAARTPGTPSAPDQPARPPVSQSASAANAATIPSNMPAETQPHSRVLIRATADSWLQIGDGRNPAIYSQVLRAGDTFAVPDRPGLKFDTGNAGGLEITVDGQTIPTVGPSGAVRRNIPLDADKLVAGAFGR